MDGSRSLSLKTLIEKEDKLNLRTGRDADGAKINAH